MLRNFFGIISNLNKNQTAIRHGQLLRELKEDYSSPLTATLRSSYQKQLKRNASSLQLQVTQAIQDNAKALHTQLCIECQQRFSLNCSNRRSNEESLLNIGTKKNLTAEEKSNNERKCYCIGCKRLFGKFINDDTMKSAIKRKLFFGGSNFSLLDNNSSLLDFTDPFYFSSLLESCNDSFVLGDSCVKYAKRLRKNMKRRYQKIYNISGDKDLDVYYDNKIPSVVELVDFIRQSGNKCAISGVSGMWLSETANPFYLTLDHIIPVSKGGSFLVPNLQIILHCLNQLKGNNSNTETIDFLNGFKSSIQNHQVCDKAPYFQLEKKEVE